MKKKCFTLNSTAIRNKTSAMIRTPSSNESDFLQAAAYRIELH